MKKLLIVLILGFCFSNQNTYTVIFKKNGQTVKYESIYYVETYALVILFENSSGEKIEIKRRKIKSIYDSNNNYIKIRELKARKIRELKARNNNKYNDEKSAVNNYTAGDYLAQAGSVMVIGDLLPIFGTIHYVVYTQPTVLYITTLSGFIIKIIAYNKLVQAGNELNKQITND